MDTLTHALSGALLARATAPTASRIDQLSLRSRLLVGFLAGAFPDSDVVIRLFGDVITYLNLHRGITHSLPLLPLWALLLAAAFALLWRGRHSWRAFYGVTLLALCIHVGGDVITTYGTKIFAPFSDYRATLPAIFIIDLVFTGIIIAGLLSAWLWRSSLPARLGLVVLVGYVGMQTCQMTEARAVGVRYAAAQGVQAVAISALPQPLSPLHWKIIMQDAQGYHVADAHLHRHEALPEPAADSAFFRRLAALYRPLDDLHWRYHPQFGSGPGQAALGHAAWQDAALAQLRRFTEYPALYAIDEQGSGVCVWFHDLRFELRNLRNPFIFGGCRESSDGVWRLERLLDSAA